MIHILDFIFKYKVFNFSFRLIFKSISIAIKLIKSKNSLFFEVLNGYIDFGIYVSQNKKIIFN